MFNEQTRPKSRPRAIFLDLTSSLLSPYAVPKNTGPITLTKIPEASKMHYVVLQLRRVCPSSRCGNLSIKHHGLWRTPRKRKSF